MSNRPDIPADGQTTQKPSRLLSLDAMRGLIIILMALDHTSWFVAQQHPPSEHWGGPFPVYDSALPFLTRLVTHLCAPGFSFLMGVGMALFAHSRRERGWSRWAVTGHLALRGAILIALQFLVVNRAWEMTPAGWEVEAYAGVLVALGGGMLLGSLLVWLKPPYLLLLTLTLLVGTELLVPSPERWGQFQRTSPVDILNPLLIYSGGDQALWSNYPVLPWLELVTFGMLFGKWLLKDSDTVRRRASALGAALLVAFLIVRLLGGFGNTRPWDGDGWIDFMNLTKYPPSIAFTLLTMGVNLLLLGLFSALAKRKPQLLQPLAVFGRVPMFFYLTHLFLYAAMGNWLTPNGTSVPAMYPYWLLGLLILYPLCLLFGRLKKRHPGNPILRFL